MRRLPLWELEKQPDVQNWISEVDQSRVSDANKVRTHEFDVKSPIPKWTYFGIFIRTESPKISPDWGSDIEFLSMMAILREDHELFKNLNSCHKDVKKTVIALSGKKKGKNWH